MYMVCSYFIPDFRAESNITLYLYFSIITVTFTEFIYNQYLSSICI